jgi:signal transduction histidine kinase
VPLDGSYVTIFEMIGGATRNFVFTPSVVAEERALEIVGFEVELSAMGAWIERGVERGPLLPESLTGSEFSNDSIFIETLLSDGETLYRRGDPFEPWYGIEKPFGDSYRGVFEDLTVRLAIDPEVAPQLVIGGLPRSRLPLLLGILALVAGLLLSAILQLRRERALIRLRSDFVSRVSHELRTPLTQIRMFAETLLLGRVRSEQEKQRAVEVIDREARRLSHLVENVLQYSRSERETTQLAVRPRRLTPLLSELVEDFNPLLDGTGARVSTHFEDGPRVSVDEDALRQIVLNLLENAVKYGPDEHEVQLGTHRSNGSVRLWVDDQGPGIRPADRERIWEPFQRVEPEVGSALTGTGIGLSVVRELVTLHGGSSWVEDGSRGGARFVVELPATAANGQGAVE